jgi:hypothetical protein
MDALRPDDRASLQADGLTRRDALLRIGAGGVAAAFLAHRLAPAAAQEGVALTSLLVGGVIPDMPPAPVEVRLSRITLEPGASSPESSFPVPNLLYVETGTIICPGAEGRILYGPDGTVQGGGAGDIPVPAGSALYTPGNVADGARNDGTEPAAGLLIEFYPVEEGATPVATP